MLWSELCHVSALIALKGYNFAARLVATVGKIHCGKKQNKKATKSEECTLAEEENVIEDVYERDGSTEEDNGNPYPFNLDVDDFITAIYVEDMKAYIGKIVDTDGSDVFATFMEPSLVGQTFKWPNPSVRFGWINH